MALKDGFKCWYNFNVVDGTDSSGNGNTLAATGTAFSADLSGKISKGLNVSTTANAQIVAPFSGLSFPSGAMSITMWIKPLGLGAGAIEGLILKGNGASDREYQVWHGTNIVARFYTTNTTNYIGAVTTTDPLVAGAAGNWQHIVITKPATNNAADIKIYFNHVLQATTPSSGGTYTGMVSNNGVFNIGTALSPATQRSNGTYDLIGICDKELTQDEVDQLWNSGNGLELSFAGGGATAGMMFFFQ